jgi:hypothetical protein
MVRSSLGQLWYDYGIIREGVIPEKGFPMNAKIRLLLVLALIALGLAAVNPGMEEFSAYIQKRSETPVNPADHPLGDMMTGISKDTLAGAQGENVVRKDFFIFSLFEIRDPRENKVHKILGFGKKIFIPLNEGPMRPELKPDF